MLLDVPPPELPRPVDSDSMSVLFSVIGTTDAARMAVMYREFALLVTLGIAFDRIPATASASTMCKALVDQVYIDLNLS